MIIRKFAGVVLMTLLTGCGVGASSASSGQDAVAAIRKLSQIPIRTVLQRNDLLLDRDQELQVFRSKQEEQAFFSTHARELSPPPDIDFDTEMGVLFALGAQPNGSVTTEIVAIEKTDDGLVIHAVKWKSSSDSAPQIITTPCHYVAIPRASESVSLAPIVDAQK